jgi:hypothetical protein
VAVFSLKTADKGKSGWKRGGCKFSFEESNVRSVPEKKQFVLSFEL